MMKNIHDHISMAVWHERTDPLFSGIDEFRLDRLGLIIERSKEGDKDSCFGWEADRNDGIPVNSITARYLPVREEVDRLIAEGPGAYEDFSSDGDSVKALAGLITVLQGDAMVLQDNYSEELAGIIEIQQERDTGIPDDPIEDDTVQRTKDEIMEEIRTYLRGRDHLLTGHLAAVRQISKLG